MNANDLVCSLSLPHRLHEYIVYHQWRETKKAYRPNKRHKTRQALSESWQQDSSAKYFHTNLDKSSIYFALKSIHSIAILVFPKRISSIAS